MEKFILPEAWCCRATNQEEDKTLTDYIIEEFGENCKYDSEVNGNCWFSNVIIGAGFSHYTFTGRPDNCTEITFQQFKNYVLNNLIIDEKPYKHDPELDLILKRLLA